MSDSSIEAACSIIKKGEEVIGIQLIGEPQREAERFCRSFREKLATGAARITCRQGTVRFMEDGHEMIGFSIGNGDGAALNTLLQSNYTFDLLPAGFFRPGFTLVIAGQAQIGEAIALPRC